MLVKAPVVPVKAASLEEEPAQPAVSESASLEHGLRGLADLALHASSAPPLTLALLGSAGSGKSFALRRLLDAVSALGARASSRVVVARVDAGAGREPASALAASVFAALVASPATAPLAHEAALSGADPHEAARTAGERLVDLRRRLDVEQQALQDLTGRKARLAETVLYRAPGSRIDGWAHANRGRIENRLRAFGFSTADPVAVYKDLVRDLSERRGFLPRAGVFLHAMWGFGAQLKVLLYAVLVGLIAWGLGVAQSPGGLIDVLHGRSDTLGGAGAFLDANRAWLDLARTCAIWVVVALGAINILRAVRFVLPLYRGVGLLDVDIQAGQRDHDSMIAHQARLVDGLVQETEAQSHRVEDAERRAAQQGVRLTRAPREASPFSEDVEAPTQQARAFFAALAHEIAQDTSGSAPQRIVVAIDDLDSISPGAAAAFVDEAALVLGRAPFVTVLAVDPTRLVAGWGHGESDSWGADRLARRVQAALRIDAAPPGDYARLVRQLLGAEAPAEPAPEAFEPVLDQPMSEDELGLLEQLAPLAGRTPRQVEQFITAYRLARPQTQRRPALAFALALDIGGTAEERASFHLALADTLPLQAIAPLLKPSRISDALQVAMTAQNERFTVADMRAAQALAARYSLTLN